MMRASLRFSMIACVFGFGFSAAGFGQDPPADLKAKIDAVVSEAYQTASAKFPCKLGGGGEGKMLSWKTVDKCLNEANDRVDWETLALRIQKIQEDGGYRKDAIAPVIEASLAAHAIPYNKVFRVKEPRALLPLSNSLLKFLPGNSLLDLPVYDRSGSRVGTFAGIYVFEKFGEISGTTQRHTLFQYTDLNGKMQASQDRLLLDSFGITWNGADRQSGFQLPADRLIPKH